MILLLLVGLLGAAGAVVRAAVTKMTGPVAGTLGINLLAAFALGLSNEWTGVIADGVRIGLLGAASTWSTLANELAGLLRAGRRPAAALYLAVSLAAGVTAAWLGLVLSASLFAG